MPVQQQMSSFLKTVGAEALAKAQAETVGKPVDTGAKRLPPGIRNGVARLEYLYTKDYEDGENKGKTFFRASATVVGQLVNGVLINHHKGEKIAGMVTSRMIKLFDIPAKDHGEFKTEGKPFAVSYKEMRDLIVSLGVAECTETEPNKIQQYWFGVMQTLTDPQRKKTDPVYVSFSTRGWTPKPTATNQKPDERVEEEWHGRLDTTKFQVKPDPAAGVSAPAPLPPTLNGQSPRAEAQPRSEPSRRTTPTPTPPKVGNFADVVAALVETAMDDPEGKTEEGAAAGRQLAEMAVQAGWSEEEVYSALGWVEVGDMALNPQNAPANSAENIPTVTTAHDVVPGSKWMFAKRGLNGKKLTRAGTDEELPPAEVEVVTTNADTKTCTVKTTRDGKDVLKFGTKKPLDVPFDWLEVMF